MAPSDSDLWTRARAGDGEAFGVLFERHARAIYNYCFRRLGDWTAAEDALSLVFLEAWRRRRKQLPPGKELPWLYGIATNVVRNQRRSRRRFAAAIRRVPKPQPDPDFAERLAERLDDEERVGRVLTLVSRLPKREQDVVALCLWSELTYEDAALALGVPIGTVRSRLARARRRLRELDASSGHEDDSRGSTVAEALDR